MVIVRRARRFGLAAAWPVAVVQLSAAARLDAAAGLAAESPAAAATVVVAAAVTVVVAVATIKPLPAAAWEAGLEPPSARSLAAEARLWFGRVVESQETGQGSLAPDRFRFFDLSPHPLAVNLSVHPTAAVSLTAAVHLCVAGHHVHL